MSKLKRFFLLLGLLVLIAGINAITGDVDGPGGPDYPRLIRYHHNGLEGELTVLGRDFRLSPEAIQAVERVETWRVYLESFLERVEEIVEKYGRQAREMMQDLRDSAGEFLL
ncbi:MAG TPA: hypothetical protein GXX34_10225 [Clostridia bacterium]|nr:hypothetical protein [Clostridia bacterium]